MNKTLKNVVIYNDEGVGPFGLYCLKSYFGARYNVALVNAADILEGRAFGNCDIFVMPGGADRPYCQKFNGEGNQNIRAYIEQGGTYLGICAGAYYAARNIEFHKGSKSEICEPRELALINTTAYGSLPELKFYHEDSLNTATWCEVTTKDELFTSYYHGGCAFTEEDDDMNVIARYHGLEGEPPAVIQKQVEKGQAILSGVHLDTTPEKFMAYHKSHPPEAEEKQAHDTLIKAGNVSETPFLADYMWRYL
ncbi:MAG: BPL-N domain-containing protein [Alphaproteobacteria bacterium]|nr:BPL-N domain-containing protein [Alphaproteobacteria bacterium]